MIRPAKNAPKAVDNPILVVSHVTAKHITITLSKNSSRFFKRAIWYNRGGTIHFAQTSVRIIIPIPSINRRKRDPAISDL